MSFTHFNPHRSLTVASMYWSLGGLDRAQGDVFQQLGYKHSFFKYDETIPEDADIIFFQGPYGSLRPLVEQLVAMPAKARPLVVYWFQQSLALYWRDGLSIYLASLFSELQQRYGFIRPSQKNIWRLIPKFITKKGARLGFLGDIFWLSSQGLIDVLVLSSTVYAALLEKYGVGSIVVPRGYHRYWGEYRNVADRDIDLLWMGKLRTRSRRRKIFWLKDELQKRGMHMAIYDGVHNDFIFGENRTRILNRTKFVLNVNFSGPTDELSIRYFIAGANGAVILREPNANQYPFIPGKHLIECDVRKMPDVIEYFLDHPEERDAIANNMLQLIQTQLTLEKSIGTILKSAETILFSRKRSF